MNDLNVDDIALIRDHLTREEKAELDRLLTDPSKERLRYADDPVGFVRNILNAEPAPYQAAILDAVVRYRRVCVRSLHGAGKSTTAAWMVLWFVATHAECKVPTTASAWRQLAEFLWPEIHKWALKADWAKIGLKVRLGRELLAQRFVLSSNAFAFAMNSVDEAKIEGAHAKALLFLFDEAKTIPADIWDAAEGALSTDNAYAVALSTPGESTGRFFEIQSRKTGYEDWHVIHIGLEEVIKAGRVTREWAQQRAKAWGENTAIYKRRVLGEFAEDEAETVIPLSLIERAIARWYELEEKVKLLVTDGMLAQQAEELVWGPLTHLGCDPARMGRDRTGYAYRYHRGIKQVARTEKQTTMQTAGRVVIDTRATDAVVNIDPIGIGAGSYDRLIEMWRSHEWRADDKEPPAKAVNVGVRTKLTDRTGQFRFRNLRDYLWWNMRELLEADEICLPPDPELTEDLVVAKFTQLSDGTIIVESKDEMRARLPEKRSTDTGDACLLAYYPDQPVYRPLIAVF